MNRDYPAYHSLKQNGLSLQDDISMNLMSQSINSNNSGLRKKSKSKTRNQEFDHNENTSPDRNAEDLNRLNKAKSTLGTSQEAFGQIQMNEQKTGPSPMLQNILSFQNHSQSTLERMQLNHVKLLSYGNDGNQLSTGQHQDHQNSSAYITHSRQSQSKQSSYQQARETPIWKMLNSRYTSEGDNGRNFSIQTYHQRTIQSNAEGDLPIQTFGGSMEGDSAKEIRQSTKSKLGDKVNQAKEVYQNLVRD